MDNAIYATELLSANLDPSADSGCVTNVDSSPDRTWSTSGAIGQRSKLIATNGPSAVRNICSLAEEGFNDGLPDALCAAYMVLALVRMLETQRSLTGHHDVAAAELAGECCHVEDVILVASIDTRSCVLGYHSR